MEASKNVKTGLVVIFNHNYEKNIPLIKEIYKSRFENIRILMPFYYGNDEEVIGVYGNSYTFQNYILQAKEKIMAMNCDSYLLIGDDVYLNPSINHSNLLEKFGLDKDSFYIDNICDVSSGEYARPILEATRFNPAAPGLDTATANRKLPSYENAYKILAKQNLIHSTRLANWKIFLREFKKPFFRNLSYNWYVIKSRCYHILRSLQYRIMPVKMRYPYVFGYSDLIVIPHRRMEEWCQNLEIFASWGMFVEMAIPTAMALIKDAKISFSDKIPFKTGNVWFPYNSKHYYTIEAIIANLLTSSPDINDLSKNYPKEYLYLHPVKLSRYAKKQPFPLPDK